MKRSSVYWLLGLIVLVGIVGTSYVGYKLVKRKQMAEELRVWEVKVSVPLQQEISSSELEALLESFNDKMDSREVLEPVIDQLDLTTRYGVRDAETALDRLAEAVSLRDGENPGTILFVTTDKDKGLAQKISQAVGREFDEALRRDPQLMIDPR